MKVCKLCKNKKSKKDYQIHSKKTNGEIRLTSRCKSCISIENKKIRDKKYNEETKLHNKSGKPIDLSVDHCHKTGVNRGLLCSSCNIGLGYFKDSPETLRSAADYLDKYNAT